MNAADYIRQLDQDLADATKALAEARRLLLRSRLTMLNVATAIREAPGPACPWCLRHGPRKARSLPARKKSKKRN
jgi:hypothetical protein